MRERILGLGGIGQPAHLGGGCGRVCRVADSRTPARNRAVKILWRCRLLAVALAAMTLLVTGGCGYHTSGHAVRLPNDIHTLYVPMFTNITQTFRIEQTLTAAVVQELH